MDAVKALPRDFLGLPKWAQALFGTALLLTVLVAVAPVTSTNASPSKIALNAAETTSQGIANDKCQQETKDLEQEDGSQPLICSEATADCQYAFPNPARNAICKLSITILHSYTGTKVGKQVARLKFTVVGGSLRYKPRNPVWKGESS
jgi:hypothetical protein